MNNFFGVVKVYCYTISFRPAAEPRDWHLNGDGGCQHSLLLLKCTYKLSEVN